MANKFIIEVRAKGFTHLNQQLSSADGAMKKFDNTGGKLRGTTSGIRREIGALRNNLLLYTFAIGAASRAMGKFLTAASDMQENLNQFRVVFGDASDEALEFSKNLSTSFKRSESDIIALMASLQDTFVPLGFSRKEAAKLSAVLTQLSYDVGSFKNASSAEVSHAFTSAIVGNHEAVRRFGISITEAELKQQALKLGFSGTSSELTSQQKILARTSLIIKGTADAQGDLINTQHEFANQVRILQDEFKDLAIDIGEMLLPMARFGLKLSDVAHLKGYALGLTGVGLAYLYVKRQTIAATIAQQGFRLALIKTGVGIAVIAFGELAAQTIFEKATEDNTAALMDYKKEMESLLAVMSNPTTPSAIVRAILEERGITILSDEEIAEKRKRQQDERRDGFLAAAKEIEEIEKQLTTMLNNEQDNRRDGFLAAQAEILAVREQLFSEEQFQQDEKRRMFLAAAAERKALEDQMSADQSLQLQNSTRGFKRFSDNIARATLEGQNMGQAVVNALQAIAVELAAQAVSFAILSLFTGGTSTASSMGFNLLGSVFGKGHTGGSITNKGVQAFANGGMIRGKDDVPILAQAGEFIMRREAVQSIGLDQLHQMNQSGQSNNMTINISAPMVDETVVDHIIPAIEKAARFNLA